MQLGTDPEFVFLGPKGLIAASDYFPAQDNNSHNNPEIGGDGHPATVELRPPPRTSPSEVVGEISRILAENWQVVPAGLAWRAGSHCEGKTLGGHLHFGADPGADPLRIQDNILTALDGVLAQFMSLLEDPTEALMRRATRYGKPSDVRDKPWGFEYRTPASFIVSPEISIGVLALGKAILHEEFIEGPSSIQNLRGSRFRAVYDIDRARFRAADRGYFQGKLDILWGIIRGYRYFFTEEGRPLWRNVALLYHIATNYPSWNSGSDILDRWGIRSPTPKAHNRQFTNREAHVPPAGHLDVQDLANLLEM